MQCSTAHCTADSGSVCTLAELYCCTVQWSVEGLVVPSDEWMLRCCDFHEEEEEVGRSYGNEQLMSQSWQMSEE